MKQSKVVALEFYDIVLGTCSFDSGFGERLGFKRVYVCGRDVRLVNVDNEKSLPQRGFLAIGTDKNNLLSAARSGANALIITDSRIDRKLMEGMKENGTSLVIPSSLITSSYSLERPKRIYMISRLYSHAKKLGIDVGVASVAESRLNMCSYMQLIGIAKLLGADEAQARHAISAVNKSIVD